MTKIYDFQEHVLKKEESLRVSIGYSEVLWKLMKDSGYNIKDQSDIDQFFKDLREDL